MKKRRTYKSWLLLVSGMLCIAAFIAVLHLVSTAIPGPMGQTIRNNIENNIEATALFYTESGDVNDYKITKYKSHPALLEF